MKNRMNMRTPIDSQPTPEHPEPATAAAKAKGKTVRNRKLSVLLALAALLIAPLLAINNPATAQPATLKQRAAEITYHTVTEIKQARTRGKVQLANADTASTTLQASGVASGSWYKQCTLPSGFNPIYASQQPDACSVVLAVSALGSCTLPRVRACLTSVTIW